MKRKNTIIFSIIRCDYIIKSKSQKGLISTKMFKNNFNTGNLITALKESREKKACFPA